MAVAEPTLVVPDSGEPQTVVYELSVVDYAAPAHPSDVEPAHASTPGPVQAAEADEPEAAHTTNPLPKPTSSGQCTVQSHIFNQCYYFFMIYLAFYHFSSSIVKVNVYFFSQTIYISSDVYYNFVCMCFTSHRQRGHLEPATPFTVPCE